MSTHYVIGHLGEVGGSLYSLFVDAGESVVGIDIGENELSMKDDKRIGNSLLTPDFMHICFPYSLDFVRAVNNYIIEYANESTQVIIHSTVQPFTTSKIYEMYEKVGYSPVRGVHPNLEKDLKKFPKFYASPRKDNVSAVKEMYRRVGMKCIDSVDTTTLEFAKLINTVFYGAIIGITQDVLLMSHHFNLNPKTIYDFVKSTGDRTLMPYAQKIGGHCVTPNAEILESFLSTTAGFVLQSNELFEETFNDEKVGFRHINTKDFKDPYFPKVDIKSARKWEEEE